MAKKTEVLSSHDKIDCFRSGVLEQEAEILHYHDQAVAQIKVLEKAGYSDPSRNRLVLMMTDGMLSAENGADMNDFSKILVESDSNLQESALFFHEAIVGIEYWRNFLPNPELRRSIKRLGVLRLTGFNAMHKLLLAPNLVKGRA